MCLSMAAERGSFAKTKIMSARHQSAQPRVMKGEGLKLFNLLNQTFVSAESHSANLPSAQSDFYSMKMTKKETADSYIARMDAAVSLLSEQGEKVSENAWMHMLADGLSSEFEVCKKGVTFREKGFDSVLNVKKMITNEAVLVQTKSKNEQDTALFTFQGKCRNCGIKGHKAADCRKPKTTKNDAQENWNYGGRGNGKSGGVKPGNWWCDHCNGWKTHGTEYCYNNPSNASKGKKGKQGSKGKDSKGKKGKGGKGRGRGNGNFPSHYKPHAAEGGWAWVAKTSDKTNEPQPELEQQGSYSAGDQWEY